jgi:hypothetical protein
MSDKSYSKYCRERADECRRRADRTAIRDVKAAFLDMERLWLAAAEYAERSSPQEELEATSPEQRGH